VRSATDASGAAPPPAAASTAPAAAPAAQESAGHGAQESAYTRLAVGCCADGRRSRARRITAAACADRVRYVRGQQLPILVTVAASDPILLAVAHGESR
jgi:hypothetical protein